MSETGDERLSRPVIGSGLFSWSFYLFGMIVTSATFAVLMQPMVGPGWGDRFFRGWIDPSLRLVVIPLVGLLLGLPLMAILNVIYVISRRRAR